MKTTRHRRDELRRLTGEAARLPGATTIALDAGTVRTLLDDLDAAEKRAESWQAMARELAAGLAARVERDDADGEPCDCDECRADNAGRVSLAKFRAMEAK